MTYIGHFYSALTGDYNSDCVLSESATDHFRKRLCNHAADDGQPLTNQRVSPEKSVRLCTLPAPSNNPSLPLRFSSCKPEKKKGAPYALMFGLCLKSHHLYFHDMQRPKNKKHFFEQYISC